MCSPIDILSCGEELASSIAGNAIQDMAKAVVEGVGAVSYTHLDVYKRQLCEGWRQCSPPCIVLELWTCVRCHSRFCDNDRSLPARIIERGRRIGSVRVNIVVAVRIGVLNMR